MTVVDIARGHVRESQGPILKTEMSIKASAFSPTVLGPGLLQSVEVGDGEAHRTANVTMKLY